MIVGYGYLKKKLTMSAVNGHLWFNYRTIINENVELFNDKNLNSNKL